MKKKSLFDETLTILFCHFYTTSWKTSDLFFFLQDKKLLDYYQPWALRYLHVATKVAGEFFGETALINSKPRSASCMAASKVKILSLDKASFRKFIGEVREPRNKTEFLIECFPKMSNRNTEVFQYPFEFKVMNRGDFITKRGGTSDHLFLLYQGEVGIFQDRDKNIKKKKRKKSVKVNYF